VIFYPIATQEDGNKAIAGMQKGDKYVVFDQGGKIKYVDLDQQQTSKSIDGCLKYFLATQRSFQLKFLSKRF
jgi:flagellar basal body rod protein FlgF